MVKDELVIKILELPRVVQREQNVSPYSYLKNIGYFLEYDQINSSDFYAFLAEDVSLFFQWVSWAEDKRSDSGCFLTLNSDGSANVGLNNLGETMYNNNYSDRILACATYIHCEIEEIRRS